MAERSSPGTKQTDGKNWVWFGEMERKLAKLSMPIPLLTVLPLNYFIVRALRGIEVGRGLCGMLIVSECYQNYKNAPERNQRTDVGKRWLGLVSIDK
jgi:hypothetical protein